MDLTLIDQAFARLVDEFDRVLDGQDVLMPVTVQVIDHRGQGGRLAGPRRPGDQHQSPWQLGNTAKHIPHAKLVQARHFCRDAAKYRPGPAMLMKGIDPKTRHTQCLKGKVDLQHLLEFGLLLLTHDGADQFIDLPCILRRQVDAPHIAIHPDHRRQPGRQMQVRCALPDSERQQFRDIH
ncbi:hypothetical protein D3C78_591920 [compost metagenome]